MTFPDTLRQSQNAVMQTLLDRNAQYGDSYKMSAAVLRFIFPDGIKPEMYGVAHKMMETFQIFRRIANKPQKRDAFVDWAGWAVLALMEFDEAQEGGQ